MLSVLSLLMPAWLKVGLTLAAGIFGVGALAWLKGKSSAAQVADVKKAGVQAILENHAVEQKEAAALTDREADDALDAAARTDHA